MNTQRQFEEYDYDGTKISRQLLENVACPSSAVNDAVRAVKQILDINDKVAIALHDADVIIDMFAGPDSATPSVASIIASIDLPGAQASTGAEMPLHLDISNGAKPPREHANAIVDKYRELCGELFSKASAQKIGMGTASFSHRVGRVVGELVGEKVAAMVCVQGAMEIGIRSKVEPELDPVVIYQSEIREEIEESKRSSAAVCALILVLIEEHRGIKESSTLSIGNDEIGKLGLALQRCADAYQEVYDYLISATDYPHGLNQRLNHWADKLNTAQAGYQVHSRIRSAVGMAELGTGIRTVKQLIVGSGVQEHQLVLPFSRATRDVGSSHDTALQITWIADNPWNTRGGFADLFVAWHSIAGKVALKRLRVDDKLDGTTVKRFEIERDTWRRTKHNYILRLLGTFMHDGSLYFVSPFLKNGSLASYIRKDQLVDRTRLLRETASAIKYLHAMGVVHGDIKADNILISDDIHAQLCDFGLAKFAGTCTMTGLKGAGSLRWQGPELWEEEPAKTTASDVYAFGMTIAEVLTGNLPFSNLKGEGAFMKAVLMGKRPPIKPECSDQGVSYARAWKVAEKCWPGDPKGRMSMEDACQSLKPNA